MAGYFRFLCIKTSQTYFNNRRKLIVYRLNVAYTYWTISNERCMIDYFLLIFKWVNCACCIMWSVATVRLALIHSLNKSLKVIVQSSCNRRDD